MQNELKDLSNVFNSGDERTKRDVFKNFGRLFNRFKKPKANKAKEHWSKKMLRTKNRKAQQKSQDKFSKKATSEKKQGSFKSDLKKLNKLSDDLEKKQILKRNMNKMINVSTSGTVITHASLIKDLEIPKGVDKKAYVRGLNLEASRVTSARKSFLRRPKPVLKLESPGKKVQSRLNFT